MPAPKWWYYFLAVCIALLTIAASYRLVTTHERWQRITNRGGENGIFNPATGETCWESDGSIDCTSFEHARGNSRYETIVFDSTLRSFQKARAASAPVRDSGPQSDLYSQYLKETAPKAQYSPDNPFAPDPLPVYRVQKHTKQTPIDSDLTKIRSRR